MINLLVTLIVLMIVAGLVWWLIGMLPLPQPFMQVAQVALILICVLVLLGMVFGLVEVPMIRGMR
jgi:hypothetical protein